MNLADAIRQAALGQRKLHKEPPPPPVQETTMTTSDADGAQESPAHTHESIGIDPEMLSAAAAAAAAAAASFDTGGAPDPIQPLPFSGNAVRLELFLTPEQMNLMLRAVMASHHSVMTLREAASYLRMTPSTLERMAQEHEVPAFVIDGRWRFPKPALDEWLAIRSLSGEEKDAA